MLQNNLTTRLEMAPAQISPFKMQQEPPLSGKARMELLKLALQAEQRRHPLIKGRVNILAFELTQEPPSFTINTCRELQKKFPQASIGILIGSDNLAELDRWHRAEELLRWYPILVFRRRKEMAAGQEKIRQLQRQFQPKGIYLLPNPIIRCSSVELRQLLASQNYHAENLRNCIEEELLELISQRGLYSKAL